MNLRGHHASLACPRCRGALSAEGEAASCPGCQAHYPVTEGILDFAPKLLMKEGYGPYMMQSPVGISRYEGMRPDFISVLGDNWDDAFTPSDGDAHVGRFLEPTHGPVLDLACGSGRWTRPIVSRFGADRVIGLDLSWAMLRAIRENLVGPLYVRGSALELPFGDGALGGVNCSNALQLIPDPGAVFQEVGRCLAPGGSFTGFTYRRSPRPVYRYFQEQHCRAFSVGVFTEDDIRQWLDAAGMDVVDVSGPNAILLFAARRRAS